MAKAWSRLVGVQHPDLRDARVALLFIAEMVRQKAKSASDIADQLLAQRGELFRGLGGEAREDRHIGRGGSPAPGGTSMRASCESTLLIT